MMLTLRAGVVFLAGAVLLGASAISAAEPAAPGFAAAPAAEPDGDGLRIRFAADRKCDAAVWIQDARGKVVRHLAAGLLGPRAPEPFRPDALEQSLVWDRRDDAGRPVDAARGPFTVRVGLGLVPAFDGLIGEEPEATGGVRALATGPDGRLYVFHTYGSTHPNDGTTAVAVYGRDGGYVRTIVPFSAGLPEERLAGLRRVELPGGRRVPFIYQFETRSFLPGLGDLPSQRAVATRDGRLAFVGIHEGPRPFAQPGEARLTVVGTDGGVPAGGPLGTLVSKLTDSGASLALSPDEKTVYATGVRAGTHPVDPGPLFVCDNCDHGGATWKHTVPVGQVYQFGWDEGQVRTFAEKAKFLEPVSVAVDKAGNVYVADLAADRVAVFDPDGKELGALAVPRPQRVEVSRKSGAVYVLSGDGRLELLKFDSWQAVEPAARLVLQEKGESFCPVRRPLMALDESGDPPVLWAGKPTMRIEDRGASFGPPAPLYAPPRPRPARPTGVGPVTDLALDRERGLLYIGNRWALSEADGHWTRFSNSGGARWAGSNPGSANTAVGLDGNYYVCQGARAAFVNRYGPDMDALPFAAGFEGLLRGFARDHGCGLTADAAGRVYAIWKKLPADRGDAQRAHALYVHPPEGGAPRRLVDSEIPGIYSVRLDPVGNIYLAAALRPGRSLLPPGLGGVPDSPRDPDAVNAVSAYPLIYGSIVKFGPDGGAIRSSAGGAECNYGPGKPIVVRGAKWIFPGASCVPGWAAPKKTPGTLISCVCELPGLDVDAFGRSFFCDAGRFRVGVLDSAGNELCWFGAYGNQDDGSQVRSEAWGGAAEKPGTPDSALRTPHSGIYFAWPQAVAAGDGRAYVGDRLNRRIVRVRLGYAAEVSCAAK